MQKKLAYLLMVCVSPTYINFLRFTAAIAVMLGHLDQDGIPMNWLPLAKFSHEAVIVFFVLSGFII